MTNEYLPEVRARAVRMVLDHEKDHASRWAEQLKVPAMRSIVGIAAEGAVMSIAAKIGCAAQTLHEWVKKAEVDSGAPGCRRMSLSG